MKWVSLSVGLICAALAFVPPLLAQESLSVSVTPPLFQLTIGPGERWVSTLKIINNNPYEVTYYATPVDFAAEGEGGKGTFIPLIQGEYASTTLGSWIEITPDPIVIPKNSSWEVPFEVAIPEGASPGGHYAAILVGTRAEGATVNGAALNVSSFVSSLLFVRIKGDVIESGRIREFTSSGTWYETPSADFVVRFENTGTTHLRPQGDVRIYNMWGKERGVIPINQERSNFGNVLPQSIRKFEFTWNGERSALDIGRYSAIVTLAYGEGGKQTTTAATYFWVVPVVPVVSVLGGLIVFIVMVIWLLRRYIRRALRLEHARLGLIPGTDANPSRIQALIHPVREGAVDLRALTRSSRGGGEMLQTSQHAQQVTLLGFLEKYSLFFFFVALAAAGGFAFWMYFESVLTSQRAFEITEQEAIEESL